MKISKQIKSKLLNRKEFLRSLKYDHDWMLNNMMGPNAVWLTEWLCQRMDLKPGMRVLDMGCGKCLSSIFLAKEFDVQVWANDLWISPGDNWKRIQKAKLTDQIFPIRSEAHALPYAEDFFDAIISVDSYHYYGTDDLYLDYFIKFLKLHGQIGITNPGAMRDFNGKVPTHLKRIWEGKPEDIFSFHTTAWWKRHWLQTNLIDVETCDMMPEGWKQWVDFNTVHTNDGNDNETPFVKGDHGRYLGFVRIIGRKR